MAGQEPLLIRPAMRVVAPGPRKPVPEGAARRAEGCGGRERRCYNLGMKKTSCSTDAPGR